MKIFLTGVFWLIAFFLFIGEKNFSETISVIQVSFALFLAIAPFLFKFKKFYGSIGMLITFLIGLGGIWASYDKIDIYDAISVFSGILIWYVILKWVIYFWSKYTKPASFFEFILCIPFLYLVYLTDELMRGRPTTIFLLGVFFCIIAIAGLISVFTGEKIQHLFDKKNTNKNHP